MSSENERPSIIKDAPAENFKNGIKTLDLPSEFGPKFSGKVRDVWQKDGKRITVTTDRTSAFDKLICTVPSKGAILNLMSAWWFEKTSDIVPNHLIDTPHVNVTISRQAAEVIPVEMVMREFMAKSSTSTSIYHNYVTIGRRNIYGIDFPDGIEANSRFPMGPILTPTTKADVGHDMELDEDAAREIADKVGGAGAWDRMKKASKRLFRYGSEVFAEHDLILADTKYEFGLDENGKIMIIDEIHTPDSSRIWRNDTYGFRPDPDSWDKDILRRWLTKKGFKGEEQVPEVDPLIISQISRSYEFAFNLITGQTMSFSRSPEEIREAIINYFETN